VPSRAKKEDLPSEAASDKANQDLWRYNGQWAIEEAASEHNGAHPKDLGLVLKSAAAHHAISRKLEKPIVFKGKDAVTLSYEVKFQKGLECGGAYIKLLSQTDNFSPSSFSDKSPYTIMFGPDKCGSTNKVHFIFRHKNKKSGKIIEHHLKNPPSVPSTFSKETRVYSLVIHPSGNSFEILIDGESKQKGSLLEDFDPPVVPQKEIDDPEDKKPSNWVDDAKIADPTATKPIEWDEAAPMEIEDEEAVKPSDWLSDEPEYVPDPEASKPKDWDSEEDGEWVAPTIANPKCSKVSGCGPWKRPMKKNPNYRGKWTAPLIDNPKYTGPWSPKKIANPEFYDEKNPGNMTPIGAIGFELWTMQNDIYFDNILVSDSISKSQLQAWIKDTWEPKHSVEVELNKIEDAESEESKKASNPDSSLPVMEQLQFHNIKAFANLLVANPIAAATSFPAVFGAFSLASISILFALLASLFKAPAVQKGSPAKVGSPKKEPSAPSSPSKDPAESATSTANSGKDALKKRNVKQTESDADNSSSNENSD
jgi:calnexin